MAKKSVFVKWLSDGLQQPGMDYRELAKLLKFHPYTIHKILRGQQRLYADQLETISNYIKTPVPVVGYRGK